MRHIDHRPKRKVSFRRRFYKWCEHFWRYKIADRWYTLVSWWDNIRRIVSYIPILWHDWDFDFDPGAFRLLRKKLQRLEPCLRHGHHLDGVRDADRILTAIRLLDRIIANDYEHEAHRKHEEKWGPAEWHWWPSEHSDCTRLEIKHPKATTPELEEQERAELMEAVKRAHERRQCDVDFVLKLISKYHNCWWD